MLSCDTRGVTHDWRRPPASVPVHANLNLGNMPCETEVCASCGEVRTVVESGTFATYGFQIACWPRAN